jgi:acyl-CoA synthetase (AMP-forming)/AMP-acid ligase II
VAGAELTFRPGDHTVVLSEDRSRRLSRGDLEIGWLAQAGRVPLGYLGDAAKTTATFPVIEGVRHAVAGDRVRLLADGSIELLGRDSVTINTGGEKVFAEEVERVLVAHPAVADAIVTSRPSERWGQEIVAVVAPRAGADVSELQGALRAHCRTSLAGYKLPKAFCWVEGVVRSPAGKPDYAWARAVADGRSAP